MVMLLTYHEGGDEGDNATICVETIGNSTHTVLTDTIADVRASIRAEVGAGRLEVRLALDLRQVANASSSDIPC